MTKARLTAEICKAMVKHYPLDWSTQELQIATGANLRSIQRTIKDLLEVGFLEQHYSRYRLSTRLGLRIDQAQPLLRNEMEKNAWLEKKRI